MRGLFIAAALAATPALADQAEIEAIVLSNTEHTLWHESAHMLISELGLPVIGQEEDAADSFATLMMLDTDAEDRVDRLLDVAELWVVSHERADAEGAEPRYYGEHDLDAQRGRRVICFLAGEGPGRAQELIEDWGLPEDRAETCADDFVQALDAWEVLLEPHKRPDPASDPGEIIQVRYEGDNPWQEVLKDEQLLEIVAGFLSYEYTLEPGLVLVAADCGEANAFWDPEARQMTLCYELLDDYVDLAHEALETR